MSTYPYPRSPSPLPPTPLPEEQTSTKEHPVSTPIPWRVFTPILFFAAAEASTYAVVFPFITDMITSFDVPADKIGLYSGLGEGVMMLVEACMATTWARLADSKGRRKCLLWGFSVTAIAMPMLGFSTSVWQVVVCRALRESYSFVRGLGFWAE
jgi:MFS family permease